MGLNIHSCGFGHCNIFTRGLNLVEKKKKTFSLLIVCAVLHLVTCVPLLATPWTVARQAPLSMGIIQARILEWAAMPSSRDLPNPGI